MQLWQALKRLTRHPSFRRLLFLRMTTQTADGTLQVGIASYIIFSPQSQPNAWAMAGVLAVSLMPYTILGPIVAPLLDRWPRRNIAMISDIVRSLLALLIGALIFFQATSGWGMAVMMGALLVALSINRFMLAGLSAGLQHTVEKHEYLSASSIVPTMGPLGVVLGGVLGFGTRFLLGPVIGAHRADGVVFLISTVLFIVSASIAASFPRDGLGPDRVETEKASTKQVRAIVSGLLDAARHIRHRPAAAMGLASMTVTRLLFGLLTVAVILVARNRWNPVDDPDAAIGDLSLWGAFTGAGFILAAVLVPSLVARVGLRNGVVALLVVGALAQAVMPFTDSRWAAFGVSFVVGLVAQSVKISVDGIVQAHVDEQYKGRAFTYYDVGFNGAYVLAAVIAAITLPAHGFSPVVFAAMALTYLVVAAVFVWVSTRVGVENFERGTGDLRPAT